MSSVWHLNCGLGGEIVPERLAVRLLGPPRALLGGRELALGPPLQRALFAVLAFRANQVVYGSELIDAVWGEQLPGRPRGGVHTYIAGLRRELEPDRAHRAPSRILESHGSGYRLNLGADGIDVLEFERLRDRARRDWKAGQLDAAERSLGAALALFSGVVLGGVPGPFAQAQRDRLAEERLAVLEDRAEVRIARGRHAETTAELRALTHAHPLRERPWALLMLALYREGRQADALAAFDQARAVTVEELGLDPGPLLTELRQRIVVGDPALSPATAAAAAATTTARRLCNLPRDVGHFTGRERELRAVTALADRGADAVVVCAIDGMAGIGKTALAVHLGQQLAERYPDAQLYLDLHAHTVGQEPVPSAQALDKLLRALDVPGGQIPPDLDGRAALWRARLAGRRVLIVLDNAVDAAQVRPLLPGSAGSLVLVTARRRLADLDGEFLTLDVLPGADAVALFTAAAGGDRAAAEPEQSAAVVRTCGYLPLAVQIAAARLRHRPAWTVAHLLERLGDEDGRLAELAVGDRSVAVAFALSYRLLPPESRRVFRLLGLVPGADFDAFGVCALADTDPRRADRILQDLVDAHLLDEPEPGRYRFHDLLGAFAAQQCRDEESADGMRAARGRLFDYYLYSVDRAEDRVRPQRLDRAAGTTPAAAIREFADQSAAFDWLDRERANFVPVVAAAAEHGFPGHAWQIARCLWGFFENRRLWADWIATHELALPCTRAVGDRLAEARILVGLGVAKHDLRRYDEAVEHFLEALALMRETGFRNGEAGVLINLGNTYRRAGRLAESIDCQERALGTFRELGERVGEAIALANLGDLYREAGRYPESIDCQEQALAQFRKIGDRRLEGSALDNLGRTYLSMRRYDDAAAYCQEALTARRETGDRLGEVETLDCLGQVRAAVGDRPQARRHWRRALRIAEELGAPAAADIAARLAAGA